MFHCGGTSDSITGPGDDGGSADGASGEASSGGEGGGGGQEGGGGKDGGHDATSSSGGDGGSSGGEGGGPEAGSSGGDAGSGEAGKSEGGSGDGGGSEAGGGEAGSGDSGSGEAGSGEAGGGDGGGADAGGGEAGAGEAGGGEAGGGDAGAGEAGSEAGTGDGGGSEGGTTEAGSEGGAEGGASDAGDAGDGGTVSQAFFRVGELMPGLAHDFCWQQGGGTWNGPVMQGWGINQGLQYPQVTEYVPVPVASTTVRFVGATATDCTTGLAEVTLPVQAANDRFFVSIFQQGTVAAQAKAFVDESPVLTGTGTRMRAIHAALTAVGVGGTSSAPVDFYVAGSVVTTSLFDDVPFGGTAASSNSVDANGYLSHDAFAGVDMRVRLHATLADLVMETGFTTTGGHAYSLFSTGVHSLIVSNKTPMQLLLCDDSAPAVGHLAVCAAGGTQL